MTLLTGSCGDPWPTDFTTCHAIPPEITPAQQLRYIRAASEYLWAMTGRRMGPSCSISVRPCRKACFDGYLGLLRFPGGVTYGTGGWIPYLIGGEFRNASLCGCTADCHCGPELCEIELPGPIYDIVAVQWGTELVDPALYRVDDGRYLVNLNNHAIPDRCWPSCQDMAKPDGTDNTFTVTYRTGVFLPALATLAVSSLAAHMMADCGGCGGCGTDTRKNLSRLTRQGVELEFIDPKTLFTDGRTGIEIVDQFIQAYGLPGVRSPLRVLSPDRHRPRQVHT